MRARVPEFIAWFVVVSHLIGWVQWTAWKFGTWKFSWPLPLFEGLAFGFGWCILPILWALFVANWLLRNEMFGADFSEWFHNHVLEPADRLREYRLAPGLFMKLSLAVLIMAGLAILTLTMRPGAHTPSSLTTQEWIQEVERGYKHEAEAQRRRDFLMREVRELGHAVHGSRHMDPKKSGPLFWRLSRLEDAPDSDLETTQQNMEGLLEIRMEFEKLLAEESGKDPP